MRRWALASVAVVRAQIDLAIDFADNDPANVDAGRCTLDARCFDRGLCPQTGCWDETCETGRRCDPGRAYCEVDAGGRFRAYLHSLSEECEAYGEWVDGPGASSTAACGEWGREVVCSTTMWSPPPPSPPPSPSAPTGDECQKYGCSAGACASIDFTAGGTYRLGGRTVRETVEAICASDACVDFMDSFPTSDSHFVRTMDTHRAFADAPLGATWRHICAFVARCETHCSAAMCHDIVEARGDGGDMHGCTGDGNLCHGPKGCCPTLDCDAGCVDFLDPQGRRRLVGGFGSPTPPPGFVDARSFCATETRRGWVIAGVVALAVAVLAACLVVRR